MCDIRNLDSRPVSGVTQTRGHPIKLARSFCRISQLLHLFESCVKFILFGTACL